MGWLAYNDPFFTDRRPYCNTVRLITKEDAINYWRRVHPDQSMSDEVALSEFMAIHWAWDSSPPPMPMAAEQD